VSTLLSRPLVSSPPRLPAPAVQATEGERVTLPCGSNHSKVEAQCGQLRPFVAPPDGLAGTRFTMFQTFYSPSTFDVISSDGFPGHSYPLSKGKLFIDPPSFLLSETGSPYILPGSPLSRHCRGFHAEFLPSLTRKNLLPTLGTPWFHATTEQAHHSHMVPQLTCPDVSVPTLSDHGSSTGEILNRTLFNLHPHIVPCLTLIIPATNPVMTLPDHLRLGNLSLTSQIPMNFLSRHYYPGHHY
jgi:hypothetical protein